MPVPASVFDDDFFKAPLPRTDEVEEVETVSVEVPEWIKSAHHVSTARAVPQEEPRSFAAGMSVADVVDVVDVGVRPPAFGGTVTMAPDAEEPDELDIPAFLRRGN